MLEAGIEGIVKRGKAEQGDKTLLDVWLPVSKLIQNNSLTDSEIELKCTRNKTFVS